VGINQRGCRAGGFPETDGHADGFGNQAVGTP
jgi:hypothetical protein